MYKSDLNSSHSYTKFFINTKDSSTDDFTEYPLSDYTYNAANGQLSFKLLSNVFISYLPDTSNNNKYNQWYFST